MSCARHDFINVQQVGEDKPPPPSPAADTGSSGVAAGFTVSGDEELPEHGEASVTEVGMDGIGSGSSRPSTGDKYARASDHPHLAYIYRGRGTGAQDGGVGKAQPDEPQEQVTVR